MSERLTDEQCRAAVRLKEKHGSERAAALAVGLSRTAFRNQLHRAADAA